MINRLVHIFYLWRLSVCATATTNILSIRKDCVTQECSLVKRYNDVFFSLKFIGDTNRGRPGDAILVALLFSLTVKSNLPSFWSPYLWARNPRAARVSSARPHASIAVFCLFLSCFLFNFCFGEERLLHCTMLHTPMLFLSVRPCVVLYDWCTVKK